MLMVESFCSGYNWSLDKALGMTMPQIVMLHHASYVNRKRSGLDDSSGASSGKPPEDSSSDDMPMFEGKAIDSLTTEEYAAYLNRGI